MTTTVTTTLTYALSRIVGIRKARRLPTDIAALRDLSYADLLARGLTAAEAETLAGCFALACEVAAPYGTDVPHLSSPQASLAYTRHAFADLHHSRQEEFWVVTLNVKLQPIRKFCATRGTLKNSLVHPRETFRGAIADSAHSILVVHNHPSGDPTPSDQDIFVTERLEKAGEVVGIPLVDHIVVGCPNSVSIMQWRSTRGFQPTFTLDRAAN